MLPLKISVRAFILGVEVTCWMITGERQSARIRSLYLKTILRQDIPFFDQETTTGEVVSRMSGDTILIQDAIGEKVIVFMQKYLVSYMAETFISVILKRGRVENNGGLQRFCQLWDFERGSAAHLFCSNFLLSVPILLELYVQCFTWIGF